MVVEVLNILIHYFSCWHFEWKVTKWRKRQANKEHKNKHKRSRLMLQRRERERDDASRSCLYSPSLPRMNISLFILLISLKNHARKRSQSIRRIRDVAKHWWGHIIIFTKQPKELGQRITRASSTSARLETAVPPDDMLVAASAESYGIIDSESINDIAQMASLPLTSQRVFIEICTRCSPILREK